MTQNHRRSGYILLFLLVLTIAVVVAVIYYKSRQNQGFRQEDVGEINNPPWQQWTKVQNQLTRGGSLGTPDEQQPKITEILAIKTSLFEKQGEMRMDRGTILLRFNPDFSIEGNWSGHFYIDPNKSREFELSQCVINGFFIPDLSIVNIEKREPNNLYFLSRGKFLLVDYNYETNKTVALKGFIYVSGRLLPDFTIQNGRAVITTETEHFRVFEYLGKAEKMSVNKLLGLPK